MTDRAADGQEPPPGRRSHEILSEEIRRMGTPVDGAQENAYWSEPPPHPNPELGCIRRGLCCQTSPGWFGPGEVEKAAAFLTLSADAFVRRFVVVDSVEVSDHEVLAFAPVKLDRFGQALADPGTKVDGTYRYFRGRCVFYADGGCSIYPVRPVECRAYVCTQQDDENLSHAEIAAMWQCGSVWEKPTGKPPA